jgi:succinoglycan biosynthesis transport protein ExoP
MDIRDYIAILWRRKWVIAVTVAVTVIVTVAGTLTAPPVYEASTTLRILTAAGGSVEWVQYDTWYADRLMNTYAQIATSGPVMEELIIRLGLDRPPTVEAEILANTELLRITVEDLDPTLARDTANALADILMLQHDELHTEGGSTAREILGEQLAQIADELDQARREYESLEARSPQDSEGVAAASRSVELKEETYSTLLTQYEQVRVREAIRANTLSIVEPAVAPRTPSKPRRELIAAMGFIVGLVGGTGLAFLFENLDTTLYTVQQVEDVTGLSTLGRIPTARRLQEIALFSTSSPQGEAIRRLRTTVFALDRDVPLRTLLVTSTEPKEGKSTVVANLAYAIAQSGRSVIVVDGDLRRPALHKVFGLSNDIGLSSILKQEATLDEVIQDGKFPGVRLLASGPLALDSAELLGSPQMTALVEQLLQRFDEVLLDTPALLAAPDAAVLVPTVDGVLLVVGLTKARQEAVKAACQYLADIKARSVGVVVNRTGQDVSYSHYYRTQPSFRWRARIPQGLRWRHVLAGALGLVVVCLVAGRLVAGWSAQAGHSTPTPLQVAVEPTSTFTIAPSPTSTAIPSPTRTATSSPTLVVTPSPFPTHTFTPPPVTGVIVDYVRLREAPSADSPSTGLILEKGQTVEVLASFGDWYQVRWLHRDEVVGWVPIRWVETTAPIPARIVTPVIG